MILAPLFLRSHDRRCMEAQGFQSQNHCFDQLDDALISGMHQSKRPTPISNQWDSDQYIGSLQEVPYHSSLVELHSHFLIRISGPFREGATRCDAQGLSTDPKKVLLVETQSTRFEAS